MFYTGFMNSKDTKKYNLINTILNSSPDDQALVGLFGELVDIDFKTAFEVWEYMLNQHQAAIAKPETAQNLESKMFALFNATSETKTRQLFIESLPLNKLVYSMAVSSCSGTNLGFLTNLILSAKIEAAEEALRCASTNKVSAFDYGEAMRRIIDMVFTTYCQQKDVKKCELNRKQSNLLIEYTSKIKGPNKSLLTQRIKEL